MQFFEKHVSFGDLVWKGRMIPMYWQWSLPSWATHATDQSGRKGRFCKIELIDGGGELCLEARVFINHLLYSLDELSWAFIDILYSLDQLSWWVKNCNDL